MLARGADRNEKGLRITLAIYVIPTGKGAQARGEENRTRQTQTIFGRTEAGVRFD